MVPPANSLILRKKHHGPPTGLNTFVSPAVVFVVTLLRSNITLKVEGSNQPSPVRAIRMTFTPFGE